jgi:hypothetical protein
VSKEDEGPWPVEDVAEVIEVVFDLTPEESKERADELKRLFQDQWTIEDTEIENEERSLLWEMMLKGVVTTETERRPHPDHGKMWRYFYWHLVPPERVESPEGAEDEEETVYDELPSGVWRREGQASA